MAGKGKGNLSLVTDETGRIKKEFGETFKQANRGGSKPADVDRVRELLDKHADLKLWERYLGVMGCAEAFALQNCPAGLEAFAELWRHRLRELREKLGYADAPEVEKLLISHATLCWLRLAFVEMEFSGNTKGSHSLASGAYCDKRLTNAQRRFDRAVTTLEKVRALTAVAERARGGRAPLPAARTGTAG